MAPTRRLGIAAVVTFLLLSCLLYFTFQHAAPRALAPDPFDFLVHSNGSSSNSDAPGTYTTTVVTHVHGFTVLENVYLKNGTLFIVHPDSASLGRSDAAKAYPLREDMLSKVVNLGPNVDTSPGDQELTFVSASNASDILGPFAQRMYGVSVMMHDTAQYMSHYYHWWGEIILGAWRVYATVDQSKVPHMFFPYMWSATAPMRFLIPFSQNSTWKDHAGISGPLMRAAFPSAAVEESSWWSDFQRLGTTVVFDRLVLVNRSAAHRHPNGSLWYKMIAGSMSVNATKGFWEPLRRAVLRGILGYVPSVDSRGVVMASESGEKGKLAPLVTYVSRQGTGRRLTQQDDEGLIAALRNLEQEGTIRFHLARMEKMNVREQIELAARTTVMVGVHGNGLTHMLWMPPSPWSTVMEIFYPQGYVFDYEILCRNVGHRHYGVWNDTFVTYPEGTYHKGVKYPEGFHDSHIPVFGPAVAAKIKERLAEQHV